MDDWLDDILFFFCWVGWLVGCVGCVDYLLACLIDWLFD